MARWLESTITTNTAVNATEDATTISTSTPDLKSTGTEDATTTLAKGTGTTRKEDSSTTRNYGKTTTAKDYAETLDTVTHGRTNTTSGRQDSEVVVRGGGLRSGTENNSQNSTQTQIEDAGATVTFKIRITSGLGQDSANPPI